MREKNLLLLLVGCDHVRYACAQLAETLLRTCPDVRILATSMELLDVRGEKSTPSRPPPQGEE
jgi:non-specific serine/threonine protein kinase